MGLQDLSSLFNKQNTGREALADAVSRIEVKTEGAYAL
jgi:hypothetical protein